MFALLTLASLALQSVADTSPFRALALPTPNRVRSASGAPGPDYWQQEASYAIQATLDTAAQTLRGSERIHYVNHSPDSLAFTGKGFIGGGVMEKFEALGKPLTRTPYGTMMRVELPAPLAPGAAIDFDIVWHFPIPPYGGGRMGHIGTRLYELGQWYPRLVVYDDVNGWNPLPYIGAGEFYLEYGDYDVTLTVPAGFVVGGTGTVQNAEVVYTPEQRARLERALTADTGIAIITRARG